jgi:hypothetical protein
MIAGRCLRHMLPVCSVRSEIFSLAGRFTCTSASIAITSSLGRVSRQESERDADTIANIAFIGGDANRELSDQRPENYLGKISKKVLESQCVPGEPSLWNADSVEQFWARRRELLAEAFNAFLAEALPGRHLS